MLYFKSLHEARPVFKALASESRIELLNIIRENKDKNLNEIARMLNMTNSAISAHVTKLCEADLIEITSTSGVRGSMKICHPKHTSLFVDMAPAPTSGKWYIQDIKVGHYTSCSVKPTCGLATLHGPIGEYDDPRYFYFQQRFDASILWFTTGYLEYNIPNDLKAGEHPTELQISFEISSEAPGYQDVYPSDIHFFINGVYLGYWISPGDFGSKPGRFTPAWYGVGNNQYGLLKVLLINDKGTFIDGGNKISDVKIDDLSIDYTTPISFRFEVPEDTAHPGGLTIFGAGFGNHNQSIKSKISYE